MYKDDPRDLTLTKGFDVSWNNNTIFVRPAMQQSYRSKYYCKHLFIRDTPQELFTGVDEMWEEDSDYGQICRSILKKGLVQ